MTVSYVTYLSELWLQSPENIIFPGIVMGIHGIVHKVQNGQPQWTVCQSYFSSLFCRSSFSIFSTLLAFLSSACMPPGQMATTLSVNSKELALTAPRTILLVQKEPALGNGET